MFKTSLIKLDLLLSKEFSKSYKEKSESLRRFLLDSPTQYSDVFQYFDLTSFHLKVTKLNQKIGLAIMSWYMNDEIRILFQMFLKENWGAESKVLGEILLNSKDFCLSWLIIQDKWNESDFFGNVLNRKLSFLWSQCSFKRMSQKKCERYSGYCRGYQESNRRRSSTLSPELRGNFLTYEEDLERKMILVQERLSLITKIREFLQKQEAS